MNNNTPDPVALAREVVDAYERFDKAQHDYDAYWDSVDHLDEVRGRAALATARAVVDVHAVVEEFASATTIDRGSSEWEGMCDHFVKKFHAALNGENHHD